MSKVIAIARREIQERSFVFVVAVGLAAAPYLALLVPSGTIDQRLELAKVFGIVIATGFVLALSMLLGASIIGREAREKRLSFYFARPVSGVAIWYGKMLAALLLLAGCAAILYAPAAMLDQQGGMIRLWSLTLPWQASKIVVIGFGIMLVAHALATMLRSRSLLILIDFVAAIVFVAVASFVLATIAVHNAPVLLQRMEWSIAVLIIGALLFAGAWQLSRGRIDPRRSHAQLSLFIWTTLAAGAIALAAVTGWIGAVTPADLKATYSEQAGGGPVALITGPARQRLDYVATFLGNVRNGRTLRVSPASRWMFASSPSGDRVAWTEPNTGTVLATVATLGLAHPPLNLKLMTATFGEPPRVVQTGIEISGSFYSNENVLGISADGSRVAVLSGTIVTVYDLATGKSVGSASISGRMWTSLQFVTPDDLRIYTSRRLPKQTPAESEMQLSVESFVPSRRSMKPLFQATLPGDWVLVAPSADGSRLIARIKRSGTRPLDTWSDLAVYDIAGSKQVLVASHTSNGWLLRDGRTVAVSFDAGRASLRVYGADGSEQRTIDLGSAARIRIIEEAQPAILSAAVAGRGVSSGSGTGWSVLRIDVNGGTVSRIAEGLAPMPRFPVIIGATSAVPSEWQAFLDDQGRPVGFNLTTGARRPLFRS